MPLKRPQRIAIELEDRLRRNAAARVVLSCRALFMGSRGRSNEPKLIAGAIGRLCAGARLAPHPGLLRAIEHRIHQRVARLKEVRPDWTQVLPDAANLHLPRAAILKPHVSPREKGVLFVAFGEWARLLSIRDVAQFASEYELVVSPSWSPPHDLVSFAFPAFYPSPVYSLISNLSDIETLPRLSSRYVVVPLFASSWVDPNLFRPLPRGQRDIDILMVANWGKFKRHHALFRALRHMPDGLCIVLIGQTQDGRTAETIRNEARAYGVEARLSIQDNVRYEGVASAFCRAKTSLVLSRREGSCVAIAESLFADTPAALLEDAHVGSRAFINSQTGRLLKDADLPAQLLRFLDEASSYSPRQWAEENISFHRSTAILNGIIRDRTLAASGEWTLDLAPLRWCPYPMAASPGDAARLEAERERIRERFSLRIGPG